MLWYNLTLFLDTIFFSGHLVLNLQYTLKCYLTYVNQFTSKLQTVSIGQKAFQEVCFEAVLTAKPINSLLYK